MPDEEEQNGDGASVPGWACLNSDLSQSAQCPTLRGVPIVLVNEPALEFPRPESEIIRKCESSALACEGLRESSHFWIGGTPRNSTPTQNHCLFDRHCAIQVGNQLSVRQSWQIRIRRLSTPLDLMQGLITDPHEGANLQVRPFLAGSDNVASLGDHHEPANLMFRQLR